MKIGDLTTRFRNDPNTYTCDKCPAEFKAGEIETEPWAENVVIVGTHGFNFNNKEYSLHCPVCGRVHFFGFNIKEKADASIPG